MRLIRPTISVDLGDSPEKESGTFIVSGGNCAGLLQLSKVLDHMASFLHVPLGQQGMNSG